MASEAPPDKAADVAGIWKHAQKILKVIQKEANSLKRASPAELTDAKWKSLDDAMSQYRLACVGISFQDLDFAQQNEVEGSLWNSHILINNIYRQAIRSLPQELRVKIKSTESQYNRFITTSQLFYKGYIQRLSQRYNIKPLHRIASAIDVDHGPQQDTINTMSPGTQAKVLRSVQETLTYLGDLARYRNQLRPSNKDNQSAVTYYSLAHDLAPDRGNALHQIGVLFLESDKHLDVVYYFFLSLARSTPHPNAQKNLESKLKAAQSKAISSQSTQPILEGRVVQLFANYVANPSFAGRDELEQTVLARLDQFLQAPHSTQVVVKIALASMGAYYYAKHQGKSLGSLYSLSFTLQLLQTLCRTIRGGVQEAQGVMPGESQPKKSRTSAIRDVSPGMDTAVRLLRLFCCWLSAHAEEMGDAPQPIQPLIEETWKVFAQTATELIGYLESDIEAFREQWVSSSPLTPPCLLEEDEETVCYLAIGDASSEVYRRLFHEAGDKNARKRTEWDTDDLSNESKLMLCLGDIVFSIQHFSDNPTFPVSIQFDDSTGWAVEYGYDLSNEPEPQQAISPDQTKPKPAEPEPEPEPEPELNGSGPGKDTTPQSGYEVATYEERPPVQLSPNFQQDTTPQSHHEVAMYEERPPVQLSPKFRPLPWSWFHQPTPTGAWTVFSPEMFEGLPTPEKKPSPVAGPAGTEDSQREMLLRMLRSASQATPQESAAEPAFPGYGQGAFHGDQPAMPLTPSHTYGTANVAPSPSHYQHLNAVPYPDMVGDQLGAAYMLYPQDQLHQQGYPMEGSPQVEHQMAAMRLSNAQNSRPRSSRRSGDRRARNQPEDAGNAGGYQRRHAHRGIGGP